MKLQIYNLRIIVPTNAAPIRPIQTGIIFFPNLTIVRCCPYKPVDKNLFSRLLPQKDAYTLIPFRCYTLVVQ